MERKIDVMIVGAQKAGTTSLLHYIGEHPSCYSHPQKEFAYFLDPEEYKRNYHIAFKKYFRHHKKDDQSLLVAKSASLYTNEEAIKHLHEHNSDCKLILILRNPVERAYSSYLMERNFGSIKYEFSELTDHLKKKSGEGYEFFINYGLYEKHLRTIYKYFTKDSVKIVLYDDLVKDAGAICKEIFIWLGINPEFKPQIDIKHNLTMRIWSHRYSAITKKLLSKKSVFRKLSSAIIPSHQAYKFGNAVRNLNKINDSHFPMDKHTREELIAFFEPHNLNLSLLINRDLSSWNQ